MEALCENQWNDCISYNEAVHEITIKSVIYFILICKFYMTYYLYQ